MRRGSIAAALLCAAFAAVPLPADGEDDGGGLAEIRVGVLVHDEGIFVSQKEGGLDINGEVRAPDLEWFGDGWRLEPHLGTSINTQGDTSKVYAGVTVVRPFWDWAFLELGVGGAAHDGKTSTNDPDTKELGCRMLFHLSLAAGAMISEHVSLSAHVDHMSNAYLCGENEGLESTGLRVGYRF